MKNAVLRHNHYKQCVENLKTIRVKQNVIRSKAHQIGSFNQTKLALTAFDTKRFIKDDRIHTLAY